MRWVRWKGRDWWLSKVSKEIKLSKCFWFTNLNDLNQEYHLRFLDRLEGGALCIFRKRTIYIYRIPYISISKKSKFLKWSEIVWIRPKWANNARRRSLCTVYSMHNWCVLGRDRSGTLSRGGEGQDLPQLGSKAASEHLLGTPHWVDGWGGVRGGVP